ncbi:hypothetical protein KKG36_01585 [Patescibacteria group bacterium]|nr:hypothetical protein [Patescibacteria group bacterium]
MLKKQGLIYLLLIVGLFSGCATLTPEMVQKKHAEWQSVVDRFEQTQGLSCSQALELYDISRLKVGSTVKTESTCGKSKQLVTKTLQDIKSAENGKRYIVNEIIGNDTFTREGCPLAFSKVICEDGINYIDYAKAQDNIPTAVITGALVAGPIGAAMNLYQRSFMQGVYKQVAQVFKEHKTETKILDFKLVSQEKLTIANQTVSCRVYQIQAITREIYPSSSDSITDTSRKVWISDDVPFGLVRSEDSGVGYNASYFFRNPRDYRKKAGETILTGTRQYSTWTSEVIEFKY